MSFKYYIQKWLGGILKSPLIPQGKTVGYSLVRSERYQVDQGKNTKVYPPFFLHEVQIGDYSYIAKDSSISHCTIGKFCSIGPHFCCGLGTHPTSGVSTAPMFIPRRSRMAFLCVRRTNFRNSCPRPSVMMFLSARM